MHGGDQRVHHLQLVHREEIEQRCSRARTKGCTTTPENNTTKHEPLLRGRTASTTQDDEHRLLSSPEYLLKFMTPSVWTHLFPQQQFHRKNVSMAHRFCCCDESAAHPSWRGLVSVSITTQFSIVQFSPRACTSCSARATRRQEETPRLVVPPGLRLVHQVPVLRRGLHHVWHAPERRSTPG